MGDVTAEELMEIEGDAGAALKLAGLDDDAPPDLDFVCFKLTGSGPQMAPIRYEGRTRVREGGRVFRVELRPDIIGTPRGRQVLAHELGHVWAAKVLRRDVSEAWCDAFGAALSAPRRATRLAIAEVGHRVSLLAPTLMIEQAAALLRVGEIDGRPTALERRSGVLVARGAAFNWPPVRVVLRDRPAGVHVVRIDQRWGMMAEAA